MRNALSLLTGAPNSIFTRRGINLNRYRAGGLLPGFVLDLVRGLYFTNSAISPFADSITHTRASTATYVDSTGTLQTAAINEPRIGHHVWNGSAWVNEGLLHESEARTNLLTYSEEFDNAAWAQTELTVTPNVVAAPTGALTADKLVESTANDARYIDRTLTIIAGTVYTITYRVRAAERSAVRVLLSASGFGSNLTANFDLAAGEWRAASPTPSAGLTLSAEQMGDGWYEISVTATATASASAVIRLYLLDDPASTGVYTGDGTSGIYAWGAQLEVGSTPSSYIPTAGSTATRAADVLTIPAANLPWNPLAVSIQMDGAINYADEGVAAQQTFLRWQLDANNYVSVDLDTDGAATGEVNFNQAASGVVDTVATAGTALAPSIATAFNIASRHGSTFINGALNGTALTADTTPVALADLSATDFNLGHDYNGTIKTLRIWAQDVGDTGIEEASS